MSEDETEPEPLPEKPKGADAGAAEEAAGSAQSFGPQEGARPFWRRHAPSLSSVLILLGIFGTLFAIATPKFATSRRRANLRSCYANQKTIAGAVEMYNLDFDTNATALGPIAEVLVERGYLLQLPDDPGAGGGSFANYQLTGRSGNGITCQVHGPIQAPTR